MKGKILIVDDEQMIRTTVQQILVDEHIEAEVAASGEEAMKILQQNSGFGAVLLDIWMEGIDGMQVLEWIKAEYPSIPVIMMSGHGNIETAVKATKIGAYDFLEKPPSYDKLVLTVSNALRESSLRKENQALKSQRPKPSLLIGNSEIMQELRRQIQVIAPTDGWVLIQGENGTGKELVARQIHLNSLRKAEPFVAVNCAAIPEELIESELFGHEKGAFTGATRRRMGKFDQAHPGTLFLDEIGDMSLKTQAKILRILQEQRFERVGGSHSIQVNVRILAASNKNLEAEIKKNNFRQDLYYRLNVIPLEILPLREHTTDIALLVNYFLEQYAAEQNYPLKKMTKPAMQLLEAYSWPGNVRELKNIVERMVILSPKHEIEADQVPLSGKISETDELLKIGDYKTNFREAKESFERKFLLHMLQKNGWNISKTADQIQLERSNLHKKIKQHQIQAP